MNIEEPGIPQNDTGGVVWLKKRGYTNTGMTTKLGTRLNMSQAMRRNDEKSDN